MIVRRSPLVVLAALLSALVVAAPAAAADDEFVLTEVGGAHFPERAFLLTFPSDRFVGEQSVEVRENGELVEAVSVVPAELAGEGKFGVVLVVDASRSMRGEAIEGALAAARAFAAERNETQQMAVVLFHRRIDVALPLTTSQAEIDAALAEVPPLALGTRMYDAVDAALSLLADGGVTAGSIVVLSDGADWGSGTTRSAVTARAREQGVRLFSVGLRGRRFNPAALEELGATTGGGYSEAESPEALADIFAKLAAKLANEYVLTYRSKARPDAEVTVSVRVDGSDGIAVSEYAAPPLATTPNDALTLSLADRYWRSPAGMIATIALAALLVALAVMGLLRPRPRTLRKRMADFVSLGAPEATKKEAGEQPDLLLTRAERQFERTRWWPRFKEELELAEIRTPPAHLVAWTTIITAVAVVVLYALGGPLIAVLALAVPILVRATIKRKLGRKRQLFADQLPDNLEVLSSALRAGHSLVGALSVVVDDCPEPSQSEFRRVVADEQLGVALDDALAVVARRMDNRDLEQVALVAALQRQTGGNSAEVLDRVADTIRSRFELRRLVKTLTTQGRMSRWIVSLLPVGLLVLITLINPEYMKPLYLHPVGRILLLFAGLMVVAGSLVIKRIVNIKV